MQKFNASVLSQRPREVLEAAKKGPVLVEVKTRGGHVLETYKIEKVESDEIR